MDAELPSSPVSLPRCPHALRSGTYRLPLPSSFSACLLRQLRGLDVSRHGSLTYSALVSDLLGPVVGVFNPVWKQFSPHAGECPLCLLLLPSHGCPTTSHGPAGRGLCPCVLGPLFRSVRFRSDDS